MAGAEETMRTDVPVPLWLTVAFSFVFPMSYLIPNNPLFPKYDHAYGEIIFVVMAINSALWAVAFVFMFRFIARLFVTKKREVKDAA